jgi:hypothetical protein
MTQLFERFVGAALTGVLLHSARCVTEAFSVGSVARDEIRLRIFRTEIRSAVGNQELAKMTGNLQDAPQWTRRESLRLSRFWGFTRITPRLGLSISAIRKSEIARKIGRIQNGNAILSCAI